MVVLFGCPAAESPKSGPPLRAPTFRAVSPSSCHRYNQVSDWTSALFASSQAIVGSYLWSCCLLYSQTTRQTRKEVPVVLLTSLGYFSLPKKPSLPFSGKTLPLVKGWDRGTLITTINERFPGINTCLVQISQQNDRSVWLPCS